MTQVVEIWPDMGLLLLSQSIEGRSAAAVARAHLRGLGYCSKTACSTYALEALTTLRKGGTVLDPEVVSTSTATAGAPSV
ncbi:MAG: hypothetical protein ABIP17_10780 [Ilumatobacteraceae bacterium]